MAAVIVPCGVGKTFSLYVNIVLIFFHTLVFQEYCALMESRTPLGPGLWAWLLLLIPLVLTNRINKTESAVFLYFSISRLFVVLLTNYETVTMPRYVHRMKLHTSFITTA